MLVLCYSFNVTAQSQSGGQKIGNSDVTGGNFRATDLVGLKTERLMKFSVDLKPPTHCLLQPSNTADNCTCFPIYLEQDVTTVSGKECVCELILAELYSNILSVTLKACTLRIEMLF